jgi:hypothetical protein
MDSRISRAFVVAATIAAPLAGTIAGCGSSSGGSTSDGGTMGGDSSMGEDSGQVESGLSDSAHDVATDSGKGDAGSDAPFVDCGKTPPTGTQIVASMAPLVLQGGGLTSDGYAFYEDTNTQNLYAVDSAGGTPTSLGSMTSQGATFYRNGGKAVLFLPAPADPMTSIGRLSAWSKASGPVTISDSILGFDAYNYNYDVTQDGAYVAFYAFDGSSVALTISTIDATTQQALITNIDLSNQYCLPFVQFVGSTLLAYYCLATGDADAGTKAGELTIVSMPITSSNFSAIPQTTLVTLPAPTVNVPLYYPNPVSPDATSLLVSTPGGLGLYPIDGSTPTTIDAMGGGGVFTPSGDVVYGTAGGGLKRYSAAADGGAPLTLDTSGATYLLSISPDGNWLQTGQNVDATGSLVDIWIASTTTPGSLTQVWSPTTASPIGFSNDSKYQTFATNVPMTFGINTFDFYASAVSGGMPQKLLTAAGTLAFTTGSKLVVNVNVDKTTGSADIESVDLANPSAPTTLVAQADPNFFYARGSNDVVYTWYCAPTSTAGLWKVAAP